MLPDGRFFPPSSKQLKPHPFSWQTRSIWVKTRSSMATRSPGPRCATTRSKSYMSMNTTVLCSVTRSAASRSAIARSGADFATGAALSEGQVEVPWQAHRLRNALLVAGKALSEGHGRFRDWRSTMARIRGVHFRCHFYAQTSPRFSSTKVAGEVHSLLQLKREHHNF